MSARRAFLFGWNPSKYPVEEWTNLDELLSMRSGDDWWDTRSSKPSQGDQAWCIKLGVAGRGFFARGVIKEISPSPGQREVTVHWDEFLDPRDRANLLGFPRPTGRRTQLWTPQSNGTEIKNHPLDDLERLWRKHVRARIAPKTLATSNEQADIAQVLKDKKLSRTEKQRLIQARLGQGLFRSNVCRVEHSCRVTGVTDRAHLRASHIKPWRKATNKERLDGNNGLLLAPHADHLFDRGYVSFDGKGRLLLSPRLSSDVVKAWRLDPKRNTGSFTVAQQHYLAYHRSKVFMSTR